MAVLVKCYALTALLMTVCSSYTYAECMVQDDDIYILSNEATTFDVAEGMCQSSYGGRFVQISTESERNFFNQSLRNKYIPDALTTVDIRTKPINLNGVAQQVYKYRSQNGYEDIEIISDYSPPNEGNLQKIMLYNRSVDEFNEVVKFCFYSQRDRIRTICDGGWTFNFDLYGGISKSTQTIKVYHYDDMAGATSELSLTSLDERTLATETPFIYLPDISVFIGAHSAANQTDWFWSNGTMITDPTNYPQPDFSVCQQMTWPLTYDDGINLRPKECGAGKAHYVCHLKANASLNEVECNGNSLQLVLPSNIATIATSIEVTSATEPHLTNVQTDSGIFIIGNLTQRANHTLQVAIKLDVCQDTTPTITVHGKTGYGEPDPVISANASNLTSFRCLISWAYVMPSDQNINFLITSNDSNKNDKISVENPNEIGGIFQHHVDLKAFGYDNEVSFMIQARSQCGNESELVRVNGTCRTPMPPPPTTTTSTTSPIMEIDFLPLSIILAIVFTIIAVIIILLISLVLYRRRKKSRSASTEADITPYAEYMEPYNVQQPSQQCYENVGDDYENVKKNHTYEVVKPPAIYET